MSLFLVNQNREGRKYCVRTVLGKPLFILPFLSFKNFIIVFLFFFFSLAMLCGLRDLSSSTRVGTPGILKWNPGPQQ